MVNAPHILADGGAQVFLCFTYNIEKKRDAVYSSSFLNSAATAFTKS